MPPPAGSGGPRWLFGRLASSVGARFHTHSAPLGAVPGRFVRSLVRCPACGRVPVTRGGSVFSPHPQDGVIVLEVCLAGHGEGFPRGPPCRLCMVASWLRVAARGSRRWVPSVGGLCRTRLRREKSLRRGCVRQAAAPGRLHGWACRGLLPGRRTPRWLELGPGSVPPRTLHPAVCPRCCGVLRPWMERFPRDPRCVPRGRVVAGGSAACPAPGVSPPGPVPGWPVSGASLPLCAAIYGRRCVACWHAGCPGGPSPRQISLLRVVPGRLGPLLAPCSVPKLERWLRMFGQKFSKPLGIVVYQAVQTSVRSWSMRLQKCFASSAQSSRDLVIQSWQPIGSVDMGNTH